MKKKKMEFSFLFFYRFKKKSIITFWPFDRGGTKRRLRGLSRLLYSEYTCTLIVICICKEIEFSIEKVSSGNQTTSVI